MRLYEITDLGHALSVRDEQGLVAVWLVDVDLLQGLRKFLLAQLFVFCASQ